MKISYLIVAILIIVGCAKDDLQVERQTQSPSLRKIIVEFEGKAGSISMLEFRSDSLFLRTLDSLEVLSDRYVDDFIEANEHLSDEDFDDFVVSEGFDMDFHFSQFENTHQFNSMRNLYQAILNDWLILEDGDKDDHPFNEYPYETSLMALLSPEGLVKTGDDFNWITKDGFAVISNNDVNTLQRLLTGDLSALSEPTVRTNIDLTKSSSQIFASRLEVHTWGPSNNARVTRAVSFITTPWWARSLSQINAYKKIGFSWHPTWRPLRIGLGSQMHQNDCSTILAGDVKPLTGEKRKHQRTRYHRRWGYGYFASVITEQDKICGYFGYGGILRTDCL